MTTPPAGTGAALPTPPSHILTRAYGVMSFEGARGHRSGIRLSADEVGLLRLEEASFSIGFDQAAPSPDAVMIGLLGKGRVRTTGPCGRRGDQPVFGPGEAFLMDLPSRAGAEVQGVDVEIAMLDRRVVEELAGTSPDEEELRFLGAGSTSPTATQQWRSTHAAVRSAVHGNPTVVEQPLVLGALARLLAATALSAFPHTGHAGPDARDRAAAHPATLRRAIAYVEGHAHEDIGAADIARAAHVSVRAVQLTFRRHLGTTPTAYLRQVRLEHAREELLRSDPGRTTVSTVAARWGFLSASTFAARYRAAFHELPSQTLQR